MPLLVAGIVTLAFASTLGNYLSWSDEHTIGQGHMVVTSAADWRKLVVPPDLAELNLYRPLLVAVNSIDFAIWGSWYTGWHLTNVLLHASCAAVFFLIARELLPRFGRRRVTVLAALAALAWAIQPMKVETVAWLGARMDSLQVFTLLAFYGSLRVLRRCEAQPEQPLRIREIAALAIALVVGLLAKESAVMMPFLLLATHAILGLHPPRRSALALHGALFGVVAAYLVLRVGWLWHPMELETRYPFHTRLLTELVVIADSLRDTLLPYRSRASDVVALHGVDLVVTIAALVLAGLTGGALLAWKRRRPQALWALAWFALCLVPVSNLVVEQMFFRGDRYVYLASFGPILFVVASGDALIERFVPRARVRKAVGTAVAVLLLGYLVAITQVRAAIWKAGDVAFFTHEVQQDPYFREGLAVLCRHHFARAEFDRALETCERGLRIDKTQHTATAYQDRFFYQVMLESHRRLGTCAPGKRLAAEALGRYPRDQELRWIFMNWRELCR